MSTFKLVCTVQPPGATVQDCPTQSLTWVPDSPPWWSLNMQQGADLASAIVGLWALAYTARLVFETLRNRNV